MNFSFLLCIEIDVYFQRIDNKNKRVDPQWDKNEEIDREIVMRKEEKNKE